MAKKVGANKNKARPHKPEQPLAEAAALSRHIKLALDAKPPSGMAFEASYQFSKRMFKTRVIGTENIPDRPCLFVGNHSLFALDGMIMVPILQKELGRFIRPMGDKVLFENDAIAKFLLKRGGVMGHPEVCSALMEAGQDLLVFPGGAHEAVKPKSELYSLQWKERHGFVKLAAKHGYTIMPFGLVGPDEFYSHLLEGSELPASPLGRVMTYMGMINDETRADLLPPIPRGSLGTLLPKPQSCYLGFGQAVDLSAYKGKKLSQKKASELRSQAATEIEQQLSQLLLLREQNRGKDGLLRRLLTV